MARLLAPDDYGVIAMSMLFVGLIQTFLDFSATVALLRKNEVTREEIDSAWTLRLIQGCLAGLVIATSAPLAVSYFEEPRLLEVLWGFAACVFLASATNVGQTLALKNFDYTLEFKISAIGKLASVLTTIAAGFALHDYRALALGIVAGYLVPLILSYVLHPYRPRWNTTKIPEIWSITKWLLLANIGGFLMRKSDELVAGRIGTTEEFGTYSVGSDLGQLPVSEIGPAMQRAILPALASIITDVERTRQAVLKTLSAISTVIWPIGFGFAAISQDATELILGSKWHAASPYVAIFAITAALQSSVGPLRSYMTILGETKIQNSATWFEFIIFAFTAVLLQTNYHLLGLAYARLISSLLSAIYLSIAADKYCDLEIRSILINTYRPIINSIIMYFIVLTTIQYFDAGLARLFIGIIIGAIFYISATIILWNISGRPEGIESTIVDKFLSR